METIKVTLSVEGPRDAALSALADASVFLWAAQAAANDAAARLDALSLENCRLRFETELSSSADVPFPDAQCSGKTQAL